MAVKISPVLNGQQFNDAGVLLVGGKIETYLAGSSTPAITYTNALGNVAQTNPILLNTRGEVASPIYLTTGINYKFILKDALNNVLRTLDNIEGVNDSSAGFDQWVNSLVAPVFINTNQFSVAGDQTNTFQVNRRVKLLVTSGIVHGYISAVAFTTLTTVTVILDSGVLDSGLTSVQLGLITPINSSLRVLQSMIASNVVGTGAAFSAFQSTVQSLPQNVNTKLQFQTKEFDTNAIFDSVTNFRFTPLIAGYYHVIGSFAIATTQTTLNLLLYKNGLAFKFLQATPSAASTGVNGSALIFLNGTTDFIELFAFQAALAQNTVATATSTYFQAFLVRAA